MKRVIFYSLDVFTMSFLTSFSGCQNDPEESSDPCTNEFNDPAQPTWIKEKLIEQNGEYNDSYQVGDEVNTVEKIVNSQGIYYLFHKHYIWAPAECGHERFLAYDCVGNFMGLYDCTSEQITTFLYLPNEDPPWSTDIWPVF